MTQANLSACTNSIYHGFNDSDPMFDCGSCVISPMVFELKYVDPYHYLRRHLNGDYGYGDSHKNRVAICCGVGCVESLYQLPLTHYKIVIQTDIEAQKTAISLV